MHTGTPEPWKADSMDEEANLVSGRLMKGILIILGTLSLALGIVGIFLPVLPTTPFLLLAAASYARSSEKFYNWLTGNRLFGRYILDYREGRGVPLRVKLLAATYLWAAIAVSAFLIGNMWIILVLLIIGVSVSLHIFMLKSHIQG
ncbi:MAG: YbaN family protein [Thermoplasmata archaeon]